MKTSDLKLLSRTTLSQLHAHSACLLRKPPASPRFVIFGQGRSGSTLLVDLLNSHPGILCEEELYHRNRNRFLGAASMYRYADGRSRIATHRGAYGFKFKIYQLPEHGATDVDAFVQRFHDQGWKFIYLWRDNLLRQVLSNFIAFLRGKAHLRQGERIGANLFPFQVDTRLLLDSMDNRANALREEARVLEGLPHCIINYEQDLLPPEARAPAMDRLTGFLGLPTAVPSTGLQRIAPESLRSIIANYDEVAEALQARDYARFLQA